MASKKTNFLSFNVNGCRQSFKRAQVLSFLEQKRVGVAFLQETHSDPGDEAEWQRQWRGQCVLSHGSNTSAGIALLFEPSLAADILLIEEIEKGRLLKVKARINDVVFTFINVYAPNIGSRRVLFFKRLKQTILNIDTEDILIVGGDFNCTVDFNNDRNAAEPHPPSSRELAAVLLSGGLLDIWRNLHLNTKQYTWSHNLSQGTVRARLDRFYTPQHSLNTFITAQIIPTSLSDHHCLLVTYIFAKENHSSSHWHFNLKLLQDTVFTQYLKDMWGNWRSQKQQCSSLQQWWDLGKVQIRLFCQHYTLDATRSRNAAMTELEREIVELESRADSHPSETAQDTLRQRRSTLSSLLEERVRGAQVRSRFIELRDMDAPSKFFFGLEKKKANSKRLLCVRLPCGRELFSKEDISVAAVNFYQDLYNKEPCNSADLEMLLQDLPRLSKEEQQDMEGNITLQELSTAATQLTSGKAPGIDGLPIDFFKHFWNELGPDLLLVLQESLRSGELPLSCRRAVIALLPKKGDLCLLKNWRPVSLLCADLKIFSKCLTNRLRNCMANIIHPDQTYCVLGRSIFDNVFLIRDFFLATGMGDFNVGLVSLDQEKAFDRVDHFYLFKTLEAFGFGPQFIKFIRLLYNNIFSVLKINHGLSQPFPVCRGIRQGCPLSGMLYSLSIEPLLALLRSRLTGWKLPCSAPPVSVKVSAYADDVTVFVSSNEDILELQQSFEMFQRASSAKINWDKTDTFLSGSWQGSGPPVLPQTLKWSRSGMKVLGVFLGTAAYMEQNWEGLIDKVRGRLERWRGLLEQMSFRGRVLVVNNLTASMLWHRLVCVDFPRDIIDSLQKLLLEFFWGGKHWLKPAVVYLPRDEGGQGLISIAGRVAAFRLQAIQRFLYAGEGAHWKRLACFFLNKVEGLGYSTHLFLISHHALDSSNLPSFYCSILKVWKAVKVEREEESSTVQSLLEEPLLFNTLLGAQCLQSLALQESFVRAGITRLGHLMAPGLSCWLSAAELAGRLGWRCERQAEKVLREVRGCLSPGQKQTLRDDAAQEGGQGQDAVFPELLVSPTGVVEEQGEDEERGQILKLQKMKHLNFRVLKSQDLYRLCIKSAHCRELRGRVDSRWRAHLSLGEEGTPEWRVLYKPPLDKRAGDLQWRLIHGILATGRLLHKIDPSISSECVFCSQEETVFHAYSDCERLVPLFQLLSNLLQSLGVLFTRLMFIFGVPYRQKHSNVCVLINFLLGQAKLAVLKSRKNRLAGLGLTEVVRLFRVLVVSRLKVDFAYFKLVSDLQGFQVKWCVGEAVCSVSEEGNLVVLI